MIKIPEILNNFHIPAFIDNYVIKYAFMLINYKLTGSHGNVIVSYIYLILATVQHIVIRCARVEASLFVVYSKHYLAANGVRYSAENISVQIFSIT